MSLLGKTWSLKNTAASISLRNRLLANRGLSASEDIERFFNPSESGDFHDPFLMKDMERAVARIFQAIDAQERIMIFGDYDVDGITGSAILIRTLKSLGANVSYRLPHRIEDGYGLREKFIHEFKKLSVKVAITVDNGISCFSEVELAQSLGIDVIITDHHTVPEKIPPAFAILHPKVIGCGYPFSELTGAGVALKLAQALLLRRGSSYGQNPQETFRPSDGSSSGEDAAPMSRRGGSAKPLLSRRHGGASLDDLFDLACMGTIADLGPLVGENRYIVKKGLQTLENTRWPGLSLLKESAGLRAGKITTESIGFFLGPRINAAGRISHPSHALRLLIHDGDQAHLLTNHLEKLNRMRQKMTEHTIEIAIARAQEVSQAPAIIITDDEFHGGIIGLIASKMVDTYNRPAIVMERRGEMYVGSCRSTPAVHIVEALKSVADLLSHFGGHAAAAGFDMRVENLASFRERVEKYVAPLINTAQTPRLELDCELAPENISTETISVIKEFEPFGIGNSAPRFLVRDLLLKEVRGVGNGMKHLKIVAEVGGRKVDCIGFNLGKFEKELAGKKSVDVACELEENTWNGVCKPQLKLVDLREAVSAE